MNIDEQQDGTINQDDLPNIHADELPLSDEIICAYLSDNPEFFNRNPDIMTSIRLVDNQRGSVSLVERQQQQLRQKVHVLEDEITQLMTVAHHNERLFMLYNDIYLRLIDCQSAEEVLDCLHQATTELLSLADLKLWLRADTSMQHASLVKNDCASILGSRLANDDYYFGRLQKFEQELIFSTAISGSVVLIKLPSEDGLSDIGFLAINSIDAEHFDPRMDTLLISQFRKLVAKLLQNHLAL